MTGHARLHLLDSADGRQDLPGRAVAALKAIAVQEGGLHRVKLVAVARPSIVTTCWPSHAAASVRQDKTRWPSMMTVHAPHAP
jgi:hypothetical protein